MLYLITKGLNFDLILNLYTWLFSFNMKKAKNGVDLNQYIDVLRVINVVTIPNDKTNYIWVINIYGKTKSFLCYN